MGDIVTATVRTPRVSELEQFMPPKDVEKKPSCLRSPITGKISKMKVTEDSEIMANTELCLIEAMKMENVIRTDFDVKIKKIYKNAGDIVNNGDLIMDFEYK
jgi:propionyl-CoA carboxylase alpha chain